MTLNDYCRMVLKDSVEAMAKAMIQHVTQTKEFRVAMMASKRSKDQAAPWWKRITG